MVAIFNIITEIAQHINAKGSSSIIEYITVRNMSFECIAQHKRVLSLSSYRQINAHQLLFFIVTNGF